MIDYRDCIVPCRHFTRSEIYVWVAYSSEPPYLPIAIATTAEELAKKMNVTPSTIFSCWRRYQAGILKSTKYHRVKVGIDHESFTA